MFFRLLLDRANWTVNINDLDVIVIGKCGRGNVQLVLHKFCSSVWQGIFILQPRYDLAETRQARSRFLMIEPVLPKRY